MLKPSVSEGNFVLPGREYRASRKPTLELGKVGGNAGAGNLVTFEWYVTVGSVSDRNPFPLSRNLPLSNG